MIHTYSDTAFLKAEVKGKINNFFPFTSSCRIYLSARRGCVQHLRTGKTGRSFEWLRVVRPTLPARVWPEPRRSANCVDQAALGRRTDRRKRTLDQAEHDRPSEPSEQSDGSAERGLPSPAVQQQHPSAACYVGAFPLVPVPAGCKKPKLKIPYFNHIAQILIDAEPDHWKRSTEIVGDQLAA